MGKARTFEEVKAIAERYTLKNDFRFGDRAAYTCAVRHGWMKEFTWLDTKIAKAGYYTYEVCCDIARGCKTRSEYHDKNKTAYRIALKNGWIDDFSWLRKSLPRRPRGFWTLSRATYAIRTCCCYKELMERYGQGLRTAAHRYGIYDMMYEQDEKPKKTDYENCLLAAIGCIDEREMREYFPKEHAKAKKNNWIGEYEEFWKL